ncbi:unnamed protein product [Pedinophyceae sp. YPF-701]|nr:unnamed protein product [Pedinophyceae sp. YPF-701]
MGGRLRIRPYALKLFASNKYVYAQVLRKADGHIVASSSTIEKAVRDDLKAKGQSTSNKDAAGLVGAQLAERAKQAGVRGIEWNNKAEHQRYHGRFRAVVDAMTANGLPLV